MGVSSDINKQLIGETIGQTVGFLRFFKPTGVIILAQIELNFENRLLKLPKLGSNRIHHLSSTKRIESRQNDVNDVKPS